MPFEKGQPKPPGSGRKKGTLSRNQLLVRELLESHGINLVDKIVKLLPQCEPKDQLKAMCALLPFVYPRLSSASHELLFPLGIPTASQEKVVAKTFAQFCIDAGYPSPFPKQVEMRDFVLTEGPPRLLLGARGYGKTDYAVIMGIADRISTDPVNFSSYLVTKSEERNAAILAEIQKAIVANGKVEIDKANAHHIRVGGCVGKDHSISAATVGSKSHRGRHPHLVVMDDPVTEEDVSEATRKKVQRTYNELIKLTDNLAIIGQPAHKSDLYQTLRPLVKTMEVPHGTIPELDHDLEAQRLAGVSEESIQASYHLKVISEGGMPFDKVKLNAEYPVGPSVAFIDPSFEGGDFTALTIGRMVGQGFFVQGHCYKRAWNHCLDQMIERIKAFHVKRICFETNSLGDQPIIMLRDALKDTGIGVFGKKSTGFKHSRIMNAGSCAHFIHLAKTCDRVYIDQVVQYEAGAKNDDAPDSLASLLEMIGLIRGKKL